MQAVGTSSQTPAVSLLNLLDPGLQKRSVAHVAHVFQRQGVVQGSVLKTIFAVVLLIKESWLGWEP